MLTCLEQKEVEPTVSTPEPPVVTFVQMPESKSHTWRNLLIGLGISFFVIAAPVGGLIFYAYLYFHAGGMEPGSIERISAWARERGGISLVKQFDSDYVHELTGEAPAGP